jgi:hypothetical protein
MLNNKRLGDYIQWVTPLEFIKNTSWFLSKSIQMKLDSNRNVPRYSRKLLPINYEELGGLLIHSIPRTPQGREKI